MSSIHADHRINELNQLGGFNKANGIKIIDWEDGRATLRVDLAASHLNPLGLVHGGLYLTMLDVALAMCGSYQPSPNDLLPGLTLSLTTQYLAPLKINDGYALATARQTGGGKSVFFAVGEVVGPNGSVIATASGVFKIGRKSIS